MSEAAVTIREANREDLPALCGLLGELFSIELDFRIDAKRQTKGLAMLMEDPARCRVFVAEIAGKVCGMCSLQFLVSTSEGALSALVEDVVVTKSARGRGLGQKLMAAAAECAKLAGAARMQLLADRNNPEAIGFYEHLGWSVTRMICLRTMI